LITKDEVELPADTVAFGLTLIDSAKSSKKSAPAENPASEDATDTEGMTN
jgi:hypothetical protein